jgi:hypothetical protein
MELWMVIVAGVAALAIVVAVVLLGRARRGGKQQTRRLQAGFGPEYAKAVETQGRSNAEDDLLKRQQRAELFPIRSLSADEVSHYRESWTATQAQFLDEPEAALVGADRLVGEVLATRGYPTGDFEQSASAVSVDHPRAVQEYRAAHEVTARNQRNAASADDLRTALIRYRTVLGELLDSNMPVMNLPSNAS